MNNKLIYWLIFVFLAPACWLTWSIFFGTFNLVESIVLMIVVALMVAALAGIIRIRRHKIWIPISLLLLVALFIPAPVWVSIFPIQDAQPFESQMAFTLLLIISSGLVLAALQLNISLQLYNDRRDSSVVEGGESQVQSQGFVWSLVVLPVLTIVLLVKALYNFYWFMVWDTTYDSLGYLWLPVPVLAVFVSGFMLLIALPSRKKLVGFLYFLLIPALIAISIRAQDVDFHQLTNARAEQVSQAIETYYAREGHYPENLRALTPGYIFPIPEPVILYGENWCYDGGKDYYRLGYVFRQHWSDPRLIGRIYKAVGDMTGLPQPCEVEVADIQRRYPDYPYEFWLESE